VFPKLERHYVLLVPVYCTFLKNISVHKSTCGMYFAKDFSQTQISTFISNNYFIIKHINDRHGQEQLKPNINIDKNVRKLTLLRQWAADSSRHFLKLATGPDAGTSGTMLMPGYFLAKTGQERNVVKQSN